MSAGNAAKPKPPSSRWGSLLSGAVAGIESRLDTILAEDGASAAQRRQEGLNKGAAGADARPVRPATPSTPARAAAVAQTVPARASTDSVSRPLVGQGDGTAQTPPRRAKEDSGETTPVQTQAEDEPAHDEAAGPPLVGGASLSAPNAAADVALAPQSESAAAPERERESLDWGTQPSTTNGVASLTKVDPSKPLEELQAQLRQAQDDLERVELRRQEETHESLERIDALQSKLQYLAREASSAARQSATEAGEETLEKRLAQQDDKIAQLMEEGIKLSKSEVTQAATIRNQRAKTAEDANALADLKRRLNRAERQVGDAAAEVSRLERERAQAMAKASRLARVEREAASLREEIASKTFAAQQLEKDLREASSRADDNQRQMTTQALEQERKKTQSLQEDIANAKIEQNIRADRAKADVDRVKDQLQREVDRHRGAEAGMRNEISSLEARIEAMRERSEEASSGSTGDAQAKLMRQIEILQSQYAVANDNWQGIETSLQSRITALERERDDSSKHETEARKKARESSSAARRLQNQLDDVQVKAQVLEQELEERKAQADKLQTRAREFETSLEETRSAFEREKQSMTATFQTKLDEERAKAQRQTSVPPTVAPSEAPTGIMSPHASLSRGISGSEIHGISSRWLNSSRGSELSPGIRSPQHYSRRSSVMPPQRSLSEVFSQPEESSLLTPGREEAVTPTVLRTPEPDNDAFEALSPSRAINDVVSTSTAGAGPSVQLVERMSASVRRLESEKAASKEEMARLQSQRDDARKEMVTLMTEVEAKRDVDKLVARLQGDLDKATSKFERMAEMFGEKTERCEELEADVADLKKIYRELVERTVKH